MSEAQFEEQLQLNQALQAGQNQPYYLYVNRLALAKHPDVAVAACTELNLPLHVVGAGPMLGALQQQAGPTVVFHGAVTDEKLHALYAEAKALLYPVEDEDFGIVPVEAMGHGVPVIAHASGGPKETVVAEKTGLFFDDLSVVGLKKAISTFEKFEDKKFKAKAINVYAQQFSKQRFKNEIEQLVSHCLV
jgi:glycosyltransferase involved in cell wall biosynthesis